MKSLKDQEEVMQLTENIEISRFPHLYEDIFKFLDTKSLCNAAQVCGDWNDIIMSSSKIKPKFQLCLDLFKNDYWKRIHDIIGFNRNINNIKIKHHWKPEEWLKNFLERFQWKAMTLTDQFVQFPQLSPNCLYRLTSLNIMTLDLRYIQNLLDEAVNLLHLKLSVSICNTTQLNLGAGQLESLSLLFNIYNSVQVRTIATGLKSQVRSLTSLHLSGIIIDGETLKVITEMPKLRQLRLENITNETLILLQNTTAMTALESLAINSSEYLFSIVTKFTPNIKRLEVMELSQNMMEVIGKHLNNLKQIQSMKLQFSDLSKFDLPQLQWIQVKSAIPFKLLKMIVEQVEDDNLTLTNFKLCLYEEIAQQHHSNDELFEFIQLKDADATMTSSAMSPIRNWMVFPFAIFRTFRNWLPHFTNLFRWFIFKLIRLNN